MILTCFAHTLSLWKVPYHAEIALGHLSAGSLRVSLEVAIDALVTRALSHALATLDVNSSLDVLLGLSANTAADVQLQRPQPL